jgi:hypothetical protein
MRKLTNNGETNEEIEKKVMVSPLILPHYTQSVEKAQP